MCQAKRSGHCLVGEFCSLVPQDGRGQAGASTADGLGERDKKHSQGSAVIRYVRPVVWDITQVRDSLGTAKVSGIQTDLTFLQRWTRGRQWLSGDSH